MKFLLSFSILIVASIVLCARTASAATIQNSDLPTAFQSCTTPTCFVSLTSTTDIGGMSAFFVVQHPAGGTNTVSWLLRYSLYSPSSASLPSYLWMSVRDQYSLTEDQHPLTIYLDHFTPLPNEVDPRGLWSGNPNPSIWDFTLNTTALLAGAGSFSASCCNLPIPPVLDLTPSWFGPCVATTCTAEAQLNLVYLLYQSTGNGTAKLAFNANDSRNELYHQVSAYDGDEGGMPFNYDQHFLVAPVPLPAATWLLVSALSTLGFAFKRANEMVSH